MQLEKRECTKYGVASFQGSSPDFSCKMYHHVTEMLGREAWDESVQAIRTPDDKADQYVHIDRPISVPGGGVCPVGQELPLGGPAAVGSAHLLGVCHIWQMPHG